MRTCAGSDRECAGSRARRLSMRGTLSISMEEYAMMPNREPSQTLKADLLLNSSGEED